MYCAATRPITCPIDRSIWLVGPKPHFSSLVQQVSRHGCVIFDTYSLDSLDTSRAPFLYVKSGLANYELHLDLLSGPSPSITLNILAVRKWSQRYRKSGESDLFSPSWFSAGLWKELIREDSLSLQACCGVCELDAYHRYGEGFTVSFDGRDVAGEHGICLLYPPRRIRRKPSASRA